MAVCEYGGLTRVFYSRKTVPRDFMVVCEYGGLSDGDTSRGDCIFNSDVYSHFAILRADSINTACNDYV